MMKQLFTLLLCASSLSGFAQKSQRYQHETFSQIDSVINVPYGEAQNVKGENEKLLLDVYSPHGDTLRRRPLV